MSERGVKKAGRIIFQSKKGVRFISYGAGLSEKCTGPLLAFFTFHSVPLLARNGTRTPLR
jgi:hypothetical protein